MSWQVCLNIMEQLIFLHLRISLNELKSGDFILAKEIARVPCGYAQLVVDNLKRVVSIHYSLSPVN